LYVTLEASPRGNYTKGAPLELALALLAKITLGWKELEGTNTLTYLA